MEKLFIESMYAFIAEDEEGEALLIIPPTPSMEAIPFLAADMERVNSLMPYAKSFSKNSRKKVKLVHFTERIEIETI